MGALDDWRVMAALKRCIAAHGGDASDINQDPSALNELERAVDDYVHSIVRPIAARLEEYGEDVYED